jgi:hypothetical protein
MSGVGLFLDTLKGLAGAGPGREGAGEKTPTPPSASACLHRGFRLRPSLPHLCLRHRPCAPRRPTVSSFRGSVRGEY